MNKLSWTAAGVGLALPLVVMATGAKGDDKPKCVDPLGIEWVLPGKFPDAIKRSQTEGKLIIIKGLGFGVDEVGAACATKGEW